MITDTPWTVRKQQAGEWPATRLSVSNEKGECICISPRFRWSEREFAMLSAAPMLYEALERASGLLKLHMPEATAAISESEAALAAARGEQS